MKTIKLLSMAVVTAVLTAGCLPHTPGASDSSGDLGASLKSSGGTSSSSSTTTQNNTTTLVGTPDDPLVHELDGVLGLSIDGGAATTTDTVLHLALTADNAPLMKVSMDATCSSGSLQSFASTLDLPIPADKLNTKIDVSVQYLIGGETLSPCITASITQVTIVVASPPPNNNTNDPGTCDGNDRQFPPSNNWASIAFEDLSHGDYDYNDMVFNFSLIEKVDANQNLTHIRVEVMPRQRLSGMDHALLLILDGQKDQPTNITHVGPALFNGTGSARVQIIRNTNNEVISDKTYDKSQDLVVFPSTWAAFSGVPLLRAVIDITVDQPTLNSIVARSQTPAFLYRFMLHASWTNMDIDIVQNNHDDNMLSSDGFPMGFMIPTDWQPPMEGQFIEKAYPHFSDYRQWLLNGMTGQAPIWW